MPSFPSLEGDAKTDVLIIGGGMTGILCAYELEQAGVEYLLIEAETICGGVSRNTTAKITAQHGLLYDRLIRQFGVKAAEKYWEANRRALERYRELSRVFPCDFETKASYVYSMSNRDKLVREMQALRRIGVQTKFEKRLPLPFPVAGAIKFEGQAQFQPLKFAAGIARRLNIREHTRALTFEGSTVVTGHGRISAAKIIVATHFPMLNKHGSYFLKLYQHRSYVLALERAPDLGGMYVDEAEDGLSFRNYGSFLLLGGGSHRTGKQGGNWTELEALAKKYYPSARIAYRWATQDCMTLDGVPYIGRYGKHTPGLYTATGFNKWGMTSSMAAAMLLSDMVQGKKSPYAGTFSPSRTMLRPQLAVNAFEAAVNLLTISRRRCPHMGCALKWNPQERSWDCPCHGSRFSEDGALLDNPATGGLEPD